MRDPAISYNAATKKYYVFATGNHIPIFTAPSLTGPWIRDGSVLPNCTIIKDIVPTGNCSLWAPDVHHIGGRFVLYYSVSSLGSQNSAIGVASSTSMEPGTWKDHGAVVRSKNGAAFNASTSSLPLRSLWCSLLPPSFSAPDMAVLLQSTRTSSSITAAR